MDDHLESIEVTKEEVLTCLQQMNSNKSAGPDDVHPRVLKELKEIVATPLTPIYNKSLSTGQLPECWKCANVVQIFKKGDKTEVGNYRPVSCRMQTFGINFKSKVWMFADDTKMFNVVHENRNDTVQNDLKALSDWSKRWQLKFNINKCKVIHYGNSNPQMQFTMPTEKGDEDLPNANTEKDLGVTFDQSLKFSLQTNEAVNKANRLIGLVRRSFDYMDKDMFLPLYKSIIRPHLEYASCIWYPLLKPKR
ncbi:uncharacterized protein [Antedon mediterranea]|uniref:uncharacterized protein n=1 Tax=Antedon mediterranea TaxID=105859 RepID=UPI003AF54FB3